MQPLGYVLPARLLPARQAGCPAGWLLCETTNSIESFACLSPFCRLCNLLPLLYHYTTTNCVLQTAGVCTWPMLLEPNLSLRTLNPRALIRRLQKLPKAAASKVRPCRAAPWARAIKNVKEPLGERGRIFRKSKHLFGPQVTFLIL